MNQVAKRTLWAVKSLPVVVFWMAAGVGCSSEGGDAGAGGDGRNAGLRGEVLAALGESVVLPRVQTFVVRATALETALAEAAIDPDARKDAQDSWLQAMEPWQELEMMQLGPAGPSLTTMGGQDLRARIYSWPNLSLCRVDQLTVLEGHDDPDALEGVAGAPLGLWAVEYLLFNESLENNCSPLNVINQDGIWAAMVDEIPRRRLEYAAALAGLLRRRAEELEDAWAPTGGNFLDELRNPGRGGALYGTAQEGLNAVSDAMFYLDKEAKDMKLAEPIGITGCAAERCPDAIESPWASRSKENLIDNLAGFQALFLGGAPGTEALGYDDLLVDMGAPDVAQDMAEAIDNAITVTGSIPGTLREAVGQDPEAVEAAHAAIRAVTDILKSDFLSVLDLEAPQRAAGDND